MADAIKKIIGDIGAGVRPFSELEREIDGIQLSDLLKFNGSSAWSERTKSDYQKEGALKVWRELGTKAATATNLNQANLCEILADKVAELTLSEGAAISFNPSSKRKPKMEEAYGAVLENAARRKEKFSFSSVFGDIAKCPRQNLLTGAAEAVMEDGFALVRDAASLTALEPFEEALNKAKEGLRNLEHPERYTPRLAQKAKEQILIAEQEIFRRKLVLQRLTANGFDKDLAGSFKLDKKTYAEVASLEKTLKTLETTFEEAKKCPHCLSDDQIKALGDDLRLAKTAIDARRKEIDVISANIKAGLRTYTNRHATKAQRTPAIRDTLVEQLGVLPPGFFTAKSAGAILTDEEIKRSNELVAFYQREVRDLCDKDDRAFITRPSAAALPDEDRVPRYESLLEEARPSIESQEVVAGIAGAGLVLGAYGISAIGDPAGFAFTGGQILTGIAASALTALSAMAVTNYFRDGAIKNARPWSK